MGGYYISELNSQKTQSLTYYIDWETGQLLQSQVLIKFSAAFPTSIKWTTNFLLQ